MDTPLDSPAVFELEGGDSVPRKTFAHVADLWELTDKGTKLQEFREAIAHLDALSAEELAKETETNRQLALLSTSLYRGRALEKTRGDTYDEILSVARQHYEDVPELEVRAVSVMREECSYKAAQWLDGHVDDNCCTACWLPCASIIAKTCHPRKIIHCKRPAATTDMWPDLVQYCREQHLFLSLFMGDNSGALKARHRWAMFICYLVWHFLGSIITGGVFVETPNSSSLVAGIFPPPDCVTCPVWRDIPARGRGDIPPADLGFDWDSGSTDGFGRCPGVASGPSVINETISLKYDAALTNRNGDFIGYLINGDASWSTKMDVSGESIYCTEVSSAVCGNGVDDHWGSTFSTYEAEDQHLSDGVLLAKVAAGTYSEHYLPTGQRDRQACRACLHGCQESFDATEHEDEDTDPDLVAQLQKMATHSVDDRCFGDAFCSRQITETSSGLYGVCTPEGMAAPGSELSVWKHEHPEATVADFVDCVINDCPRVHCLDVYGDVGGKICCGPGFGPHLNDDDRHMAFIVRAMIQLICISLPAHFVSQKLMTFMFACPKLIGEDGGGASCLRCCGGCIGFGCFLLSLSIILTFVYGLVTEERRESEGVKINATTLTTANTTESFVFSLLSFLAPADGLDPLERKVAVEEVVRRIENNSWVWFQSVMISEIKWFISTVIMGFNPLLTVRVVPYTMACVVFSVVMFILLILATFYIPYIGFLFWCPGILCCYPCCVCAAAPTPFSVVDDVQDEKSVAEQKWRDRMQGNQEVKSAVTIGAWTLQRNDAVSRFRQETEFADDMAINPIAN